MEWFNDLLKKKKFSKNDYFSKKLKVSTCVVLWWKVTNCRLPPYPSDLVPSKFFLFPNLNKWLDGKSCGFSAEKTLIWSFWKSHHLERVKNILGTKDEVYWSHRRLRCGINFLVEIPVFHSRRHELIDTPRLIFSFHLLPVSRKQEQNVISLQPYCYESLEIIIIFIPDIFFLWTCVIFK